MQIGVVVEISNKYLKLKFVYGADYHKIYKESLLNITKRKEYRTYHK